MVDQIFFDARFADYPFLATDLVIKSEEQAIKTSQKQENGPNNTSIPFVTISLQCTKMATFCIHLLRHFLTNSVPAGACLTSVSFCHLQHLYTKDPSKEKEQVNALPSKEQTEVDNRARYAVMRRSRPFGSSSFAVRQCLVSVRPNLFN